VRVLLTRPQADAERTAAALRRMGHQIVLSPMLRIETLPDVELGSGPWSGVALTSANAARAIASHARIGELVSLTAFTVGRQTAEAAKAAGFRRVESADGSLPDLVQLLAGCVSPAAGELLYLAGAERSGDLAGALGSRGVRVRVAVVYRAAAVENLPEEARAAFGAGRVDAVLHFSRRSASAFLVAVRSAGLVDESLGARHYCLSAQVAEPLLAAGMKPVLAAKPEEEALLALLDA